MKLPSSSSGGIKRSFSDVNLSFQTNSVPVKRSHSDGSVGDMEEKASNASLQMYIDCQYHALCLELFKSKRQIKDTRLELDLMRLKSREMETLVGVVQRAWAQLEIDSNMILDELGDNNNESSSSSSSSSINHNQGINAFLNRFLYAGSYYNTIDPTDITSIPTVRLDQWSSSQEIKIESETTKKLLNNLPLIETKVNVDVNSNSMVLRDDSEILQKMNNVLGDHVESHLQAHTKLSFSILEKLCTAISESQLFDDVPKIVNGITIAKELYSERFVLTDKITKLSSEIVQLNRKLTSIEQLKLNLSNNIIHKEESKVEKGNKILQDVDVRDVMMGEINEINSEINPEIVNMIVTEETLLAQENMEKELRKRIIILEKQITDCQLEKSKVEMTLTERMAVPLTETNAQITLLKTSMENLRSQSKQRVSVLIGENMIMTKKLAQLQVALSKLEIASNIKIEEGKKTISTITIKYLKEKDILQSSLSSAQSNLVKINKLKSQSDLLQKTEVLIKKDNDILEKTVKDLVLEEEKLQENLKNLRSNEIEIEKELLLLLNKNSFNSSINMDKIKEYNTKYNQVQEEFLLTLESISELVAEIDGVQEVYEKDHIDAAKIINQIVDNHNLQRSVVGENLRLSEKISDLNNHSKKIDSRFDVLQGVIKTQEVLISKHRNYEQNLKIDNQTHKRSISEIQDSITSSKEVSTNGINIKLSNKEKELDIIKAKNLEITNQCDILAQQLHIDRKIRMDAQREIITAEAPVKRNKIDDINNHLSKEDNVMLEMSLGMLRCSLCCDRFKDCVITKCFHLYCKECLDKILRKEKNPKCPSCSEKYTSDDIKHVYFTH